MTFWWLNMERGSKSLGLSSCWPQLVQLLSCWKEIHHMLFSAFCNSSHAISYFGLWQVPPLPGPVFSPTAREPLAIFPTSPSEDGDAFFLGSAAVWQENEPLPSGGCWHCWQTILRWREGAGRPDSRLRWGLQGISASAVSVLCVLLCVPRTLLWQWQWCCFALS